MQAKIHKKPTGWGWLLPDYTLTAPFAALIVIIASTTSALAGTFSDESELIQHEFIQGLPLIEAQYWHGPRPPPGFHPPPGYRLPPGYRPSLGYRGPYWRHYPGGYPLPPGSLSGPPPRWGRPPVEIWIPGPPLMAPPPPRGYYYYPDRGPYYYRR